MSRNGLPISILPYPKKIPTFAIQNNVMAIPREKVEEILQAARIEEVVGEFMTLKKRGSNLIGCCPFHNEKTPSFNVNPARNIFKCFGCGKAGDAAKFLMEHEHLSYPEALRYLAKKYNIKIEEKELSAEEVMAQTHREKMFNINEFANKYFTDSLWNHEEGQTVGLAYFRERGYLNPIIERFQLGYCPKPDDAFTSHAIKNGYSKELLMEMGLSKEGKNGLYDFYHGRVMFPIHNVTGHVVGFGGRTLFTDKKIAKYFNSPESEIYQKKDTLYGIYFAKTAIVKEDSCILVEGYFDVLRLHQIGIENVVASSGTSLTQEQIKLVKRYTKNITMLYDGDAAGLHAALRGTDMILSEGMSVRVVALPPEHDPDTFGRDFSTDEVKTYLTDNARDFIRFKTELLLKDADNDPIKRTNVIRDILESISVIPDSLFRTTYIKECSLLLNMPEQTLTNELNKLIRAKQKKALGIESNDIPGEKVVASQQNVPTFVEDSLPPGHYQEQELVKLLLMYGSELVDDEREDEDGTAVSEKVSVAQLIIDDLRADGITFHDDTHRKIFDIFDRAIDEGKLPDDRFFTSHEDTSIVELAADLLSTPYKLDNWDKKGIFVKKEEQVLKRTVVSSIYRYKDLIIEQQQAELEKQLKESDDIADQFMLLQKKKDLDKVRMQINKMLGIVIAK